MGKAESDSEGVKRSGRTRLSLDVTPEARDSIRALLNHEKCKARTITDLIQRSIATYDFLMQIEADYGRCKLKTEDGTELPLPSF